jgi:hypothetical protein
LGFDFFNLSNINFIIADHLRLTTKLAKIPREVVHKAVVVVDDKDHFFGLIGGRG